MVAPCGLLQAALVQKVKNVTFEMLAEHFESGLKEAAASLGLSPTSLKRACRCASSLPSQAALNERQKSHACPTPPLRSACMQLFVLIAFNINVFRITPQPCLF